METPPYTSLSIQSNLQPPSSARGLKISLAVTATTALALAVALVALLLSPAATAQPPALPAPIRTRFNILQVNDVYEMGDLSRVATLRQELQARTPLTLLALAGDLLSPSPLSLAKVFNADAGRGGEALDGAQMVDVFNTMHLDFAVLGNHEFDLKAEPFWARMNESEFPWITTNARLLPTDKGVKRPDVLLKKKVFDVGGGVTMAVVGWTMQLPGTRGTHVEIFPLEDAVDMLRAELEGLEYDILVAITHQSLAQDKKLAEMFPEISLIIAGHEHENVLNTRYHSGGLETVIAKADSNAASAFVHTFSVSTDGDISLGSELIKVDDSYAQDSKVQARVDYWRERAFDVFHATLGSDPAQPVVKISEALDGRMTTVRTQQTPLGHLIAQSLAWPLANTSEVCGSADITLFHSGAIRIDDFLERGSVTLYDLLRVLPYSFDDGAEVVILEVTGAVLKKMLTTTDAHPGAGSYMQRIGVEGANGQYQIDNNDLEDQKLYRVGTLEFVATGQEQYLSFFNADLNGTGVTRLESKCGTSYWHLLAYMKTDNCSVTDSL